MASVIEKLEGLECRLKVSVSQEKVKQAYNERLKEVAKSANLKGFRPGKVPVYLVEAKFGRNIRQEIASELIQSSLNDALMEHELRIAGRPHVEQKELVKDKPFEYKATFEVYPEISLKDLTGIAVEKFKAEVTDSDVDTMIEKLRKMKATWEDVERKAQMGDRLIIDFEGLIGGVTFEAGSAKNFQIELGAGQMIPDFEKGLVGAELGNKLELKVTFPENYPAKDLAGKEVVFKVMVHAIKEPRLPPLDDEFAKQAGFDGGVEALKEEVRKNMKTELNHTITALLKNTVLEKMLELNKIEVPKVLVENEITHLQQMTRRQLAMQQNTKELPKTELSREPYFAEANKRVVLGLLLAEVIKQYKIQVDRDKVREKVNEIASVYQKPDEIVSWYYKNENMLAEIEALVLEEEVVNKLLEEVTIEEKEITFDELMNKQKKVRP